MHFNLIWIKEKNWQQYELNLLVNWWDENFIRKFLAYRWVVVVSLTEFKEDPKNFWNISISATFENTEIWFLTSWETLEDKAYFFITLWLSINYINFVDKPIPDWEMQELIKSTLAKIIEEDEEIKRQQQEKEIKEKQKYSESAIDDSLKIINLEIDHIDQIIKAWTGIISWADIKKMEDLCNEMKKIRLWTNFNKMASLILDAHEVTKKAENELLSQDKSKIFLIDKNSITTNVDFISELSSFRRISEKVVVQPNGLTTDESIRNILWIKSIFLRMLLKDFFYTFEQSSIDELFGIVMNFVEYITLIVIAVISVLRVIQPILWFDKFSLYLLPALWRLWLLVYLFNSLNFKWIISKIVGFIVLAIIYWYWLILLKGTFAL